MARVFTLLSPGQVNLQHDGPIADEDAIRDDEGKAFIMVADEQGPYKFKGGVGSQGRVSLVAVDPGSGKVIGPADRKADDKIIKTFIGKAGMQYFEPARETQPGAPGGGASLLALTPKTESLERRLDEALGLDEAKSERDKIRAQMKRTDPFRPTDVEFATKWRRVGGPSQHVYKQTIKQEKHRQERGEDKKEVEKGLDEALGLDEAKSERDKIRAQMKRSHEPMPHKTEVPVLKTTGPHPPEGTTKTGYAMKWARFRPLSIRDSRT